MARVFLLPSAEATSAEAVRGKHVQLSGQACCSGLFSEINLRLVRRHVLNRLSPSRTNRVIYNDAIVLRIIGQFRSHINAVINRTAAAARRCWLHGQFVTSCRFSSAQPAATARHAGGAQQSALAPTGMPACQPLYISQPAKRPSFRSFRHHDAGQTVELASRSTWVRPPPARRFAYHHEHRHAVSSMASVSTVLQRSAISSAGATLPPAMIQRTRSGQRRLGACRVLLFASCPSLSCLEVASQ